MGDAQATVRNPASIEAAELLFGTVVVLELCILLNKVVGVPPTLTVMAPIFPGRVPVENVLPEMVIVAVARADVGPEIVITLPFSETSLIKL